MTPVIAIVGGGPSGFYAAEALFKRIPGVQVDIFDRLPTPFGLVRTGVAPDHPKIKQVAVVFEAIAKNNRFNFIGNVDVGADIALAELMEAYNAVILASGASTGRHLGVPGEELIGCHRATEFVGWYNGHPDYRDRSFDFQTETAVVIGHGNVAADVARVLARRAQEWRSTDMCEHAIDALEKSKIREIHVIGRRGPAQAKFTAVELKEFGEIAECIPSLDPLDLDLNEASLVELAERRNEEARKNIELFRRFSLLRSDSAARTIKFRFFESPISINGNIKVESITLGKNRLVGNAFQQVAVPQDKQSVLRCGLVFSSVGYRGSRFVGASFDERTGTIPNIRGRCMHGGLPIGGLYVTGWIKRGPTGIIGTNRADSVETVESLVSDLAGNLHAEKMGIRLLEPKLRARGIRVVNYQEWGVIDSIEKSCGMRKGKPREKLTRIQEMVDLLGRSEAREAASDASELNDEPQR